MFALFVGSVLAVPVSGIAVQQEECSMMQAMPKLPEPEKVEPQALLENVVVLAHSLDEQTPDAVKNAISTVEAALDSIQPGLQTEHNNAKAQVDELYGEIDFCRRNLEIGHAQTLASHRSEKEERVQAHAAAEQTVLNACDNRWFEKAHTLSLSLPPSSPSDAPAEFYDRVKEWHTFIEVEWAEIESEKTECDDATTALDTAAAAKNTAVSEYEASFCRHRLMCDLTTACGVHEAGVLNTMKPGIQADELARQDQFKTVSQVDCILALIRTAVDTHNIIGDASLAGCDDVSVMGRWNNADGSSASVSDYTITFADVPDATPEECPDSEIGDPECPDEDESVIESWTAGVAVMATTTTTTTV